MPSTRFIRSAFAPETAEVWIPLVTIQHSTLSEPIRVANNLEDITSNGNLFKGCPFEPVFPGDTDDGPPGAKLRISNVSQEIVKVVREIDTPASVDLQLVLASDPDTIEAEYNGLELRDVTGDAGYIEGILGHDDLRLEPFPYEGFSPTYFPGLF